MDGAARLQQIYDDAGRPGAAAFRFAVRRTVLHISDADAKAFVAAQPTNQILQGRIPSDGQIVGGGREDMRWQMDLIDWSKRIRKLSGGHRYVLVAVDNYNRQAFTQPMQRKTGEATLEAFRKIIRANGNIMPKEITVDLGHEYAMLEQEIASNGGVLRRKNMLAVNTLAVVDRVIGKLKTISTIESRGFSQSKKRNHRAKHQKQKTKGMHIKLTFPSDDGTQTL